MLAVAAEQHEIGDGFAYEFKWDGVRALVACDAGTLQAWSRKGADISLRYPELAGLAAELPDDTMLDGEIVAFDEHARPSFARLQRRMNLSEPGRIRSAVRSVPVAYLAFDLLRLRGRTQLHEPYEVRRQRLLALGLAGLRWQAPPHRSEPAEVVLKVADELDLEGVVAKRLGSTYQPGRRSADWRKVSRRERGDFVVGGYRPGQGSRGGRFGSLLLGYHDDDGHLRFAGSVGSGFTEAFVEHLHRVLEASRRLASPFADDVPHADAVFVEPRLVAVVQFNRWTPDGILRQPSFKGLRDDVDPDDVVMARPNG